jgi:hypothetical protein
MTTSPKLTCVCGRGRLGKGIPGGPVRLIVYGPESREMTVPKSALEVRALFKQCLIRAPYRAAATACGAQHMEIN